MKTKWFFHNLSSHLPSCFSSVFSSSKAIIKQDPFSKISTFVLNHVDISLLLSICGRESNNLHLASSLHASVIKNFEFVYPPFADDHRNALVVWNSIISAYAKGEALGDAAKLFEEMPVRDNVSWNTVISGFLKNGGVDHGFGFLKQMLESDDYTFDQATLTTVLTVCDKPEFLGVNKMLHCLVFISGYEKEISVGNALITSYFKCSCSSSGRQVFEEMMDRNVITWTALISGYAQNEFYEESLKLLVKMRRGSVNPNSLTYLSLLTACPGLQALKEGKQIHTLLWKLGIQSDLRIESALMDMYSKCGNVEDAWKIFEDAEELDEVSMTVVLVGLAQNGFDEEAVQFFLKMTRAGFEIDVNVISAILGASGADASIALAKQLHGLVIKRCFGSNTFVNNGLINMYSKSGLLDDSIEVFKQMPQRNTVSWNSLIAGYARHGDALRALESYELMSAQGIKPTDVTFLSLLHACSHVGLVQQGMELLTSMIQVHGIKPRIEHYSCVIDMLGRAGLLQEAKSFADELPVMPDVLIWQALMGACSFHGDTQIGNYAAEQLYLAAPESPAAYILMANIYSSKGKWSERARTIKRMKEMGVAKETGVSWIEIEKRIHSFVVEDKMHPEAVSIYRVLSDLFPAMIDHGYKPDKRFILYYLEENKS